MAGSSAAAAVDGFFTLVPLSFDPPMVNLKLVVPLLPLVLKEKPWALPPLELNEKPGLLPPPVLKEKEVPPDEVRFLRSLLLF